MIIRDFMDGGFPVSRRAPVVCFLKEGSVAVASNNAELKTLAPKSIECLGIWPGKRTTGVFVLTPSAYTDIPTPPAGHEDIDSSEDVSVYVSEGGFDRVEYVPGPHANDRTPVLCRNASLATYVKDRGIRHKTVPH